MVSATRFVQNGKWMLWKSSECDIQEKKKQAGEHLLCVETMVWCPVLGVLIYFYRSVDGLVNRLSMKGEY